MSMVHHTEIENALLPEGGPDECKCSLCGHVLTGLVDLNNASLSTVSIGDDEGLFDCPGCSRHEERWPEAVAI